MVRGPQWRHFSKTLEGCVDSTGDHSYPPWIHPHPREILVPSCVGIMVTGQLADKPTRGQSGRGLVNSRTIVNSKCFI